MSPHFVLLSPNASPNVARWEGANAVCEKKNTPTSPNASLQRLPVVKLQHCNQVATVLQQTKLWMMKA